VKTGKVTNPKKKVTDPVLLGELERQGIDKDYVEFTQDYGKRIRGKSSPYAKFYRDLKTDTQFMVVSMLPMATAEGELLEAAWAYDEDQGIWHSRINLFYATVIGNTVKVIHLADQPGGVKKSEFVEFQPQLFLNGKEVKPKAVYSDWFERDPENKKYHQNVLQWDYGICKRRLRLIEGALLGTWIFSSNPNVSVGIKYNQSGDFNLHLGRWATDKDTETIPADFFNNPQKYGMSGYPLVIQDSATLYSDADNYIYSYSPTSNYGSEINLTVGDLSPSGNISCRSLVRFDLSAISPSASVSAATLSLYEYDYYRNYGPTSFTMYLNRILVNWSESESTWNTYSTGNNWNTAGCGGSGTDYDTDVSAQLTLDTTPADDYVAWNGVTLTDDVQKFVNGTYNNYGWRLVSPDQEYQGSGYYNTTYFYSKEKGTGYKPKLVVTYTAGETKQSSDGGSGTEAVALRELDILETGNGLEQSLGTAAILTSDAGTGSDMGGLLQSLFGQDEGSGSDNIEILTTKAGSDLRLLSHHGQLGIPHKEVRL
jgi:hypothetical protein